MTNMQNRQRWAANQRAQARAINAERLETERFEREAWIEWNNMFFGNMLARLKRGDHT
jgi:hypothetical protein